MVDTLYAGRHVEKCKGLCIYFELKIVGTVEDCRVHTQQVVTFQPFIQMHIRQKYVSVMIRATATSLSFSTMHA
jgi:hypothetical protein